MFLTLELIRSPLVQVMIAQHLRLQQLEAVKIKRADQYRAWAAANPEKVKAAQEKYNKTEKARERFRRHNKTEKGKANNIRYRERHPEKIVEWRQNRILSGRAARDVKAYKQRHPDRVKETKRRSLLKHRAKVLQSYKTYYQSNKARINKRKLKRHKERYAADPIYRLRCLLRGRFRAEVGGKDCTSRVYKILGCTIPEFKAHLESKFLPGMTWQNYGVNGPGTWNIDHIKPLAKFDLSDPAQVAQAFHFFNTQPLWSEENIRKGDAYEEATA